MKSDTFDIDISKITHWFYWVQDLPYEHSNCLMTSLKICLAIFIEVI